MTKKLVSVILLIALTAGMLSYDQYCSFHPEETTIVSDEVQNVLHLWYTDDALTDYLNSAALEFYEKTGARVQIELKSGLEYLEEINEASLYTEEGPDVYIVSDDSLEKAYLSGLAIEIMDEKGQVNSNYFPKTALHAVTYKNHFVAYPFTYETSAFVYNKTHLREIARKALEQEQDLIAGEEAQAKADAGIIEESESEESIQTITDEMVEAKAAELLPESIDKILEMADAYDPAEGMEGYLKWDVSDIFYNYFFIGDSIQVGGENGDDIKKVNIYNEDARMSLDVYQRLNQFFSIDAETTDYASVIEEFKQGKYLFTIATTDIIKTLDDAIEEGTFAYEYGIAELPMVSDGTYFVEAYIEDEDGNTITDESGMAVQNSEVLGKLDERGLSVTMCLAINGYSDQEVTANQFAEFLSTGYLDTLYDRTGKVACSYLAKHKQEGFEGFMKEYEKSISMPKVTAMSNFWVELEVLFTKVWTGDDSDEELRKVAERMERLKELE